MKHEGLLKSLGHIEVEKAPPTAPELPHRPEHPGSVLPKGMRVSDEPREIGWGQEVELTGEAPDLRINGVLPGLPIEEERSAEEREAEVHREHHALVFGGAEPEANAKEPDLLPYGPSDLFGKDWQEPTPEPEQTDTTPEPEDEGQRFVRELFGGTDG